MNRNPTATTARSQLGAWACARAAGAHMSRKAALANAALVNFGDASPDPGSGGVSS
jgi:hypothetical protein